jgi:septum formation protein
MLKSLSNKTHLVITGYALISKGKEIKGEDISKVTFNTLSDEFINEYIDNKRPFDKAGSYGIQDGYNLVKKLSGSFDNVVGLPSEKIGEILKEIFTK